MKDARRGAAERTWDTIVVGSGAGGLTAAVALARAGQRVLVLEQHYLPGGWTHSFSLEGYRFSPGVHYVGDLHRGGMLRRIYEGLGVARDLTFCEMNPDAFDHYRIAGERIDQPKGLARWKARLAERFPSERTGIDAYFETLQRVAADIKRCEELLELPRALLLPFRAPELMRWGFRTLAPLLDRTIDHPLLRAVLSAQSGNHGLAPSQVSLPLHAAMTCHYLDGAYYPSGGAKRIPAAYLKELRRHGGELLMSKRVARIRVERGRVRGAELEDGTFLEARHGVSNADPAVTYGTLLGRKDCLLEALRARRARYSVSAVSLFCAVDLDLGKLGFDSGNYWYYRTTDVDGAYRRMARELPGDDLECLFVAVTSLKDKSERPHGHHTLEMFTFAPFRAFERWKDQTPLARGSEYDALKRRLGDAMIRAAERIIPDLERHVVYREVGTPLTNDFYCETHHGALYGTAKTPWQVGPFAFRQKAPVEGLYLCGASTLSHGVAGATLSGLVAAQGILGLSSFERTLGPADGSLRVLSWTPADAARAASHLHV